MALHLTTLPPEILHRIAESYLDGLESGNNVGSVLSTCSLFRDLFLPKLYSAICLCSLEQLSQFVSPSSGSHQYCPLYTTQSIIINIPGVPGGGDGTLFSITGDGKELSRNRLLLASRALSLCPRVRSVSLEFFSVRHSELLTSAQFREAEATAFESALNRLSSLETLRWTPPRIEPSAIMGLSIVVVDQVIQPLARGLAGCQSLRALELWNTMLPDNGGSELAASLISLAQSRHTSNDAFRVNSDDDDATAPAITLNMRSVTGLDPKVVSELAMARPPIKINIADGFIGSIWGPRLDSKSIEECVRDAMDAARSSTESTPAASSTGSSQSSSPLSTRENSRETTPDPLMESTIRKITDNVTIKVLRGGIAGSRLMSTYA
ncbi:hypothetical protein BCV70DRAFT_64535 [Testicularia cyperi]|uniref:F-box domain-containing protein n=1 Tax=Testicularia cyperi TaxID=1882483 RepID=A0A317XGN9_9BASI|nr:hypothetical protein BCV70DRAFT_64535 [Testicularia cyperi]